MDDLFESLVVDSFSRSSNGGCDGCVACGISITDAAAADAALDGGRANGTSGGG